MRRLSVLCVWFLTFSQLGCETSMDASASSSGSSGSVVSGKADQSGLAGDDRPPHGAIDWYNDPGRIDPDFVRRYAALPQQGVADRTPWTDTYWPKHKGGIGYRWQTDESHTYQSPARDQVLEMSPEQVALLSPAEKYDLLVGAYEYPLTLRSQAENRPNASTWTGYCHGWTTASIQFEEPNPVVMTNPDGVKIPFGSSDIKALLTYYSGDVVATPHYGSESLPFLSETLTLGTLCGSESPGDRGCSDVNPGAFHVMMTNLLGLRSQPFGIDATSTREKWNQPVHRFMSSELMRRSPTVESSEGTVEEIIVASDVTYTQEIHAMWEPVLGTMHHSDTTKRYTYSLELNAEGEIIGGQWVILMDNGEPLTLHDAWAWVSTVDANGDGLPDHSVTEARSIIWEHYDFPDYAWSQTAVGFSDTFKPAASGYSFIANSLSTRTDLYHYFARLRELYLASTSVGEVEDRAESTGVEPADSGFEADSEQPGQ